MPVNYLAVMGFAFGSVIPLSPWSVIRLFHDLFFPPLFPGCTNACAGRVHVRVGEVIRPPSEGARLRSSVVRAMAIVLLFFSSSLTPPVEGQDVELVIRRLASNEPDLSRNRSDLERLAKEGAIAEEDLLALVRFGRRRLDSDRRDIAELLFDFVADQIPKDLIPPATEPVAVESAPEPRVTGMFGADESERLAMTLRVSTGHALALCGESKRAISLLRPWIERMKGSKAAAASTSASTSNAVGMVSGTLLKIGADALDRREFDDAILAYDLAIQIAPDAGDSLATAMLGRGWATGSQGESPREAADQLQAFVRRFPEHGDACAAATARLACLRQIADGPELTQAEDELLAQWPHSGAADEIVSDRIRGDGIPSTLGDSPATREWVGRVIKAENDATSPAAVTVAAFLAAEAASLGEPCSHTFEDLASVLVSADSTGEFTSVLLQSLAESSLPEAASSLFALATEDREAVAVAPLCQESACRWAGQHQNWEWIASSAMVRAGPKIDPPEETARTMATERLFAEALLQLGRLDESLIWWRHVVDVRGDTTFASRLRCAEAATSAAPISEAESRVAAASAAAGSPEERVLVDLLRADLAIRQLNFDRARYLLTEVVRGATTPARLRGRAQWLIGETYSMQRKFEKAIDAYRSVEGLDDQDHWTPVALVQAGNAFEQLARTREAVVCYFTLVNRFADSPHAKTAQRRLALLQPNRTSNTINQSGSPR